MSVHHDEEEQRPDERPGRDEELLVAVPGLARIAAAAYWRAGGWAAGTTVRAGSRVLRAAATGESPTQLFQEAGAELREHLRRLLEVVDPEAATQEPREGGPEERDGSAPSLRDRGAELLRRSADVRERDETHPAYERILEQLAPDEGRILRLLATEGPQPAVDVRSGPLPLNVASDLVAPGLNMIGAAAGCRRGEQVPAYLNNLYRLGLIWFSREPLPGPEPYQVLEAQPEVVDAMREAGRGARTVRRSIYLTPFGTDFCSTCLPLDTVELDALPGDAPPPAG